MNKWKIAFWICFTSLILLLACGLYVLIEQGTTLNYLKEGYANTDNDLTNLTKIINETDLSKEQIGKALIKHKLFEYMDFTNDTVSLDRITLIFKDNKLNKITKQW